MRAVTLALLVVCISTLAGVSGVTRAEGLEASRYARAAALDADAALAKVRNINVVPHWINGRDEFWYRRDLADGHEFVRVDARRGHAQPAFDHAAVARELTRLGIAAEATSLPFATFEYADRGRAITFAAGATRYRCAWAPARCRGEGAIAPPDGSLPSPDGQVSLLSRAGNLVLRDSSGGERLLTIDGEPDHGYGVYPDTWKAAYVPRQRAGSPPEPLGAFWAPDSSRAIVTSVDQRHVARYPFVEAVPRDGSVRPQLYQPRIALVGERPPAIQWHVVERATGAVRRLELPYDRLLALQPDMMPIRRTWWSVDAKHLFAVAFGTEMRAAYLFDIDLESGRARTVVEEHGRPRVDLNSTSYNLPNVHVTRDGREIVWFSQRDGWGHLYLYDARSGVLKGQITHGAWLVRDLLHVDEARRRIFFSASGREPGNPYDRYLYVVNFDGSGLQLLSPERGDHLLTSPGNDILSLDGAIGYPVVSPSGDYVVYNHAPVDRPTNSVVRRVQDAALVSVFDRADASALLAAGFRPPETFTVKAADGVTDLWGVLYLPADFDPSKRYPVIDVQYASPLTAVTPRNFVQAVQGTLGYAAPGPLTQLGFAVMMVDARGTTYRSREFTHWSTGRLATMGLEDHVAALKALGKDRPYLDLDRVGISGLSYGGWTSLRALVEFPEMFKAAVAGVAPGGMHTMYTDYHWTVFQGEPRYADGEALRPGPTDLPMNYASLDVARAAPAIRGALMLVVAELDENVLSGSSLPVVSSLIAANTAFDLLYLPSTAHLESVQPYVNRRAWEFLVRELRPPSP
jgi:dipeptidyl-peptidase-4